MRKITHEDWLNSYLYDSHSKDELASWARRMRFFRFVRATPGAPDGDTLRAVLHHDGEQDLVLMFEALGIPVVRLPEAPPKPQRGTKYTGEEWASFIPTIEPFLIKQPHHVLIAGQRTFVSGGNGAIGIDIVNEENEYEVSEASVEAACRVETLLARWADRVLDPPYGSDLCICPKFYPEIWDAAG